MEQTIFVGVCHYHGVFRSTVGWNCPLCGAVPKSGTVEVQESITAGPWYVDTEYRYGIKHVVVRSDNFIIAFCGKVGDRFEKASYADARFIADARNASIEKD